MSRRRYISTDISTDTKMAELAEYGPLPLLLYTWAIPHMDDWARMTGDPRQFKLLVCPALDTVAADIEKALEQIASVGLWERYQVSGRWYIAIPEDNWFKYQTYINKNKRDDDSKSNYPAPPSKQQVSAKNSEKEQQLPNNGNEQQQAPQITEEQQGVPQKTASPSPSPSPSKDHNNNDHGEEIEKVNIYKRFEQEFASPLSPYQIEQITKWITEIGPGMTLEALKRAVLGGKFNFKYIDKIILGWTKNNVRTVRDAEEADKQFEQSKGKSVKGKSRESPVDKIKRMEAL